MYIKCTMSYISLCSNLICILCILPAINECNVSKDSIQIRFNNSNKQLLYVPIFILKTQQNLRGLYRFLCFKGFGLFLNRTGP